MKTGFSVIIWFVVAFPGMAGQQKTVDLAKGLTLYSYQVHNKFTGKMASIQVLRIDPAYFHFRLINASSHKPGQARTAKAWAGKYKLVAAINASMYRNDHLTSVGYMKNGKHVNNARFGKDNIVFVFGAKNKTLPVVRMIDRQCDDYKSISTKYNVLIQNIRMFSCKGKNVWSRQAQRWSTAAVAMDKEGRVLFIHVRSPFRVHDFINHLKKLPIRLDRAMYVEGGPEAQLYIKSKHQEFEFVGSYETGFNENDNNHHAWKVPNVIGIVPANHQP